MSYMNARSGQLFPFDFARDGRTIEVRCRHRLAVGEGIAYVSAALAGLGVIQVPQFLVRDDIEAGMLVTLLEDWVSAPRPLYLVYPPNRHVSVRLRTFIDWVAPLFVKSRLG